ncbi:MAG: nuclear transport factor 2 family protein [Planctomycetota bacterium]|jgi:ketosteroid isomerase-like protein
MLRLVLLLACAACATTPNDGARDVGDTLDRFHAAAAAADEDAYFALLAPEGVFLGTDATERWPKAEFRAYAHPHFSKGQGWTYVPRDRHIAIHGDVAWFDEMLDNEGYGELRGTGALRRIDGLWRIVQYNLTFTIPNERAEQVVELIK